MIVQEKLISRRFFKDISKKHQEEKTYLNIKLSLDVLNKIIVMIFTEKSPLINLKSLNRIRNLFLITDKKVYENDINLEVRFFMITKLLEKLIVKKVEDRNVLSRSIMSGKYSNKISEIYEYLGDNYAEGLDEEIISEINELISDRLQHAYLKEHAPRLYELTTQIISDNYTTLEDVNEEFKNELASLTSKIKEAEDSSHFEKRDFGSEEHELESMIASTIEELNQPENRIITGIKDLNVMLNGGFERGKTYCFFGIPKGFKSGILLNLCLMAKKYNKISTPKDGKKPCIIYLSQENKPRETLTRLWSYYMGNDSDLKKYTTKEAMKILAEKEFSIGPIALKILFRPNKSISTRDLDSITDNVESNGYKCILFVHDYLKRIRSADNIIDERIRLGEVVNEMSVFATERDFPFITASQLNRKAIELIEALKSENKGNIGRQIGSSTVGESALILENLDVGIIIAKEFLASGNREFLSFKEAVSRQPCSLSYFLAEFEKGSTMKLKEDYLFNRRATFREIGEALGNPAKGLNESKELTDTVSHNLMDEESAIDF